MKLSAYLISLLFLLFFSACCKKDRIDLPGSNNIPGLPPVTQSGANTLGFLLNGVPWTPAGNNSLTIDYDPGFNRGILNIAASRKILNVDNSSFSLGIGDSLNFITIPMTYSITQTSLGSFYYSDRFYCERISTVSPTYTRGNIFITTLNKTQRVIAGTFEATLFNPLCGDTIKITNGRFDLKF